MKAFAAAAMNNSSILDSSDYKALVFLTLDGGNDSFNMLIPRGATEYAEYATTRSDLAIAQADLLAINPLTSDGKEYGLNPSMQNMQQLFETNKLAFLSNVGTLIEPTNMSDYNSGAVDTPLGLFSHSDQAQHMQTGRPHERTNRGWGGRIADLVQSMNTNENISMNISLNGINFFQYGNEVIPFVITTEGAISIEGYEGASLYDTARTTAMNSMMDRDYQDIYKDTFINTVQTSNDAALEFQAVIDTIPDFTTPYPDPDNYLARQLRMVGKIIAARNTFGFKRQTFFIRLGGWDHHAELLHNHGELLSQVDVALNYFNGVMEELDMHENVTTFNVSDFGRTLTSNGNGSDHAWGGNTFMMGGSVIGKDMYGNYPSLALNSDLSLYSRGVLIPTTPTDMYFAELAQWFGVPNSDLDMIFPNLSNFYDTSSGVPPIGFMNI
jgi:uncharacterized protein (DUF1501 family)